MAYAGLPITLGGTNTRTSAILSEYVSRVAFNNITSRHALLAWLKEKTLKRMAGGTAFYVPIRTVDNSNFAGVARMGELTSTMADPVRRALYQNRTVAGVVSISEEDLADNAGTQGGIMSVLAENLAAAEDGLADTMATYMAGGAAAASATNPDGIAHLIRFDPTNTVGGLDRSSVTQYKNKTGGVADFSNELAAGGANLIELIRKCSDGVATPDALFCDETTWSNFAAQYVVQQELTTVGHPMANLGFMSFSFQGIPVYWDSHIDPQTGSSGYGGDSDVGVIYVLSSKGLALMVRDALFKSKGVTLSDFEPIPNQLAIGAKMAWRGNLGLTEGRSCGIFGIEAF